MSGTAAMKAALVLLIAGGINWGLVGLFHFDLVAYIFGSSRALLARAVYVVIAVCGVFCVPYLFSDREGDRRQA